MSKNKHKLIPIKWLENDLSNSMDLTSKDIDDYRHMKLYPTFEDVNNESPSLQKNRVNEPYSNCDEYLDTFFRLMREDFVSVVRDTLKYFRPTNYFQRSDYHTIWYFQGIKILNSQNNTSTIFIMFVTPNYAKAVDYENSKQFKNGALLLLSNNNFITFTLGVVTNTFRLNKGIVGVDVINYKEVRKWKNVDLLEPTVFYEPYRYVMAVFQDMNETNFPMKKYIVHSHKNIKFPKYLAKNSIYNINGIEFDVHKNKEWPSFEVLNMDINQYKAFKGALTNEFAMIQGPPGTGKTYIGLEIVKIIIDNMYKTKKLTDPIMIVCMTNHALDQFLEGIWKITRNISRLGCGSKSDILVNYIPKISIAREDSCADVYANAKRDVNDSFKKEKLHFSHINQINDNQGVLDLSCLMNVINFRDFGLQFKDSYDLLSWLMFDISTVESIHPLDFIKQKKILDSFSIKLDKDKNKLYCITLKSIKLYCTQIQCKLNNLNKNLNEKDGNNVSLKKDFELTLKIMKTVVDYLMKHLKIFRSESPIKCRNKNYNLLGQRERWLLYYKWVRLFLIYEKNIIEDIRETTRQCSRNVQKFKSIGYFKTVKKKYVIGMTTTAAAKNRYLLKNLKCPIVIIEEAAEVLEPHIVASLSEFCQHLILIGDHKQLRPHTANHLMAKNYQLDVSLFERMVNNEIPSYVLAEQHRMRPEIAGLISPAIYPHLRNHSSVENRPHIRGVGMDLFCITHSVDEEKIQELSSYINSLEAKFLVAFANYLLKQGYYPEDITIMAMYNAQVLYISELIKVPPYEHLKDVRVSSVDGYQGEENDIILLSLVRSNSHNSVGFLKTDNRVCVALSRARLGFYIAGNLNLLARASDLWKKVEEYLCKLNALGPNLLLKCQAHQKCIGDVSNYLDFDNLKGCKSMCNTKLLCGHLCNKKCHIEDNNHLMHKCTFATDKKCSRGHKSLKMCYEECDSDCEVFMSATGDCGHIIEGKCCDFDNVNCQAKVNEVLQCGHSIMKSCYEPSICNEKCYKTNSNCPFGHVCKRPCGMTCDSCIHPIPIIMKCGHISEFLCSQEPYSVQCAECMMK